MKNKPCCSPSLDTKLSHHFTLKPNPNVSNMQHANLATFLSNESLQYLVNPSEENVLAHDKCLEERAQYLKSCKLVLSPITVDDNEVSDEHLSSSTPEILINNHPTSLKTKENKHSDAHIACEVEAQNNAMQTSSDFGDTTTGRPCAIPESFTPVLKSPLAACP